MKLGMVSYCYVIITTIIIIINYYYYHYYCFTNITQVYIYITLW